MMVTLSHKWITTGEWRDDFTCDLDDPSLARWLSTYIRNDIDFRLTPLE